MRNWPLPLRKLFLDSPAFVCYTYNNTIVPFRRSGFRFIQEVFVADIVYTYDAKPYLNITNQCPCACTFCIRAAAGGLGSAGSLWHAADPGWDEIERAIVHAQPLLADAREAVFCGYGEPFCALENLVRSTCLLKARHPHLALRVNTNGLGDLINGRPTAGDLEGFADTISISLNAPNATRYHELVQSRYGVAAYDAMLRFAEQCKSHYPSVVFTVVDVLTPEEICACQTIAQSMRIPLRVRNLL
jgi:TatD family-associated radical SAM protein